MWAANISTRLSSTTHTHAHTQTSTHPHTYLDGDGRPELELHPARHVVLALVARLGRGDERGDTARVVHLYLVHGFVCRLGRWLVGWFVGWLGLNDRVGGWWLDGLDVACIKKGKGREGGRKAVGNGGLASHPIDHITVYNMNARTHQDLGDERGPREVGALVEDAVHVRQKHHLCWAWLCDCGTTVLVLGVHATLSIYLSLEHTRLTFGTSRASSRMMVSPDSTLQPWGFV